MSANVAISIGNFDGVHLGHQQLIAAARAAVGPEEGGGRVIVLAFDPPPASVLRPEVVLRRLSRFDQRSGWLTDAGADEVMPLIPTPKLLNLPAEVFLAEIVNQYQPRFIVEGVDFRFGHRRAGTVQTLRTLEPEFGYRTIVVPGVEHHLLNQHRVRVSSSLIRWLIERGRMRDAEKLLGRPYEIRAEVVRGDQCGRDLDMPTANLDIADFLLPGDGIYAGLAHGPDGNWHPAAISVGTKPTFGSHPRTCEAHLIGFDGPLDHYHWQIQLQFHHWLRDQIRYDNLDALRAQLARDLQCCKEWELGTRELGIGSGESAIG